jgi:hypothetical protein
MSGTEKLEKFAPPTNEEDPAHGATQKMDKFILPDAPQPTPMEEMSASTLEAVVGEVFERELRESQRMQAVKTEERAQIAEVVAPPPVDAPAPVDAPPPAEPDGQDPNALRTAIAKKFVSLADDVNEAFAGFHIGGGDYVVELTQPQGPSTGGGRHALQHLRLRPRRAGFPVIVGGSVDGPAKCADLRDFAYVHLVHTLRFDSALDLGENEREQFLRKAEVVLKKLEITTRRVSPPGDMMRQASAKKISRPMLAAFIVVTVLASFVVWRVLIVLLHPR